MNEPAIRTEEQIISLFPDRETFVCRGWVLKKMGESLLVYPLYYKFSEGDIVENVRRCEEISRQCSAECVFRIVEHTNYHLSAILTDSGYVLRECGIVGELYLPDSESCLNEAGKVQDGLSLRKGADDGSVEYIVAEGGTVIGIKRRELLFLLDGKLPDDVTLENVLQFSKVNGIKNVLADIPETEKLPEEYERAGFQRSYLYRCYQMEEKHFTEEKSSGKEEDWKMDLQNEKCVMVIDENLPLGIIANTAAIMGITLGKQMPEVVGADVYDRTGNEHLGIIEFPVPILKGNVEVIKSIREKLYEPEFSDLTAVDFSDLAQGCKTYDEFIGKMKDVSESELNYYGIAICGAKKKVNKLTGSMALLR